MQLKPTITFDQYYSVVLAVNSQQPKPQKKQWPGMLIGIAIGLTLVFLYELRPARASAYILGLFFVMYASLCKPFFLRRYKAALRKSFEQQSEILNGNVMEITISGITGSWVRGNATYEFRWQAFSNYLDRPEDFLFLYAPCCWVRIPKDYLTEDDQKSILAWYKAAHGQFAP